MSLRSIGLAITLLAIAALAAACGGGDPTPTPRPASAPVSDESAVRESDPAGASDPIAPTPTALPSDASEAPESQTRRVSLSAGEVNDNQRWDEYLLYRSEYSGPSVHDADVSERYIITVRDSLGRPVPNAAVRVSVDQDSVFEGRTYANGQTLFFPLIFPQTESAETFSLEVEKSGVGRRIEAERHGEPEWVVELDIESSYPDGVALDLLFLLDATGSMSDEITQIKETPLSVSARIGDLPSRPDLRFGMVTYRDREDEFITRVYDFNPDVQRFLNTIREVSADGGGDTPESLNEALHVAVREPTWRQGDAIRLVFLVADAPPHLDYPQDYDYAEEMVEANRRGIKIFSIASSGLDDQGEYVFRQIAQHTMGRFIFIVYGGNADGSGGTTSHHVEQYTVEQLDDLVVKLVEEELAFLAQ